MMRASMHAVGHFSTDILYCLYVCRNISPFILFSAPVNKFVRLAARAAVEVVVAFFSYFFSRMTGLLNLVF